MVTEARAAATPPPPKKGSKMQVTGLTAEQVSHAVRLASGARFEGNITLKSIRDDKPTRDGRPRATFTLKGQISGFPGTRRAFPGSGAPAGALGRSTISACWHAHDAVFRIIYAANAAAIVKTALATYIGAEDYRIQKGDSAWLNTGSTSQPYYHFEGCDCDHVTYTR